MFVARCYYDNSIDNNHIQQMPAFSQAVYLLNSWVTVAPFRVMWQHMETYIVPLLLPKLEIRCHNTLWQRIFLLQFCNTKIHISNFCPKSQNMPLIAT